MHRKAFDGVVPPGLAGSSDLLAGFREWGPGERRERREAKGKAGKEGVGGKGHPSSENRSPLYTDRIAYATLVQIVISSQ